jgi:type IV pilus assembly protein PilM
MKTAKISPFFHNKPLFGMEIGHGSLKVMQLAEKPVKPLPHYQPRVLGYGFTSFDMDSQKDGVIVKPAVVAKAAHELFQNQLVGDITSRRVAIAIPTYRAYTRALQLPSKLKPQELTEAVQLEAEQYIPLSLEELYLDYDIIRRGKDETELFAVAVPRTIVDSYLELAQIIGLEAVLIEPTLSSSGRLFSLDEQSDVPAIIINLGSVSSDISIFDKHILVTGTVKGGGEDFTRSIAEKLGVSQQEAASIKTRDGLSKSERQAAIREALEPILREITREIRRMMRYYEERYGADRPIGQVITLGGGANIPGLDDYLIETMQLAVRHSDPWQYFDSHGLEAPAAADRPMYATAAGLSLADPKEVFRHA